MKKHLRYNPLFWLAWFMRVVVGFTVFYDPFWGSLLIFAFDYFDSLIVCWKLGLNDKDYYKIDKYLDWANNSCMLFASVAHNSFVPLLALFLYRLLGYLLNLKFKKGWLYILFPNLFDFVFFWYAIQYKFGGSTSYISLLNALPILLLFKELQEIFNYVIYPKMGYPNILTIFGKRKNYFGKNVY